MLTLRSDTNLQSSPTQLSYSQSSHGPSASLQQSSPSAMSRLRASSSAFPPGLDLRNQYQRGISHSSAHGVPTPRSSSFSHSFSGGFASAPLTAPVDFQLPRTPIDGPRDFSIPQLSAPMQPPQDFQSAYNSNLSPVRGQHNDREFNSPNQQRTEQGSQSHTQTTDQEQQQNKNNEETSYLSPVRYEAGQKRKRSFTMPGQFEKFESS